VAQAIDAPLPSLAHRCRVHALVSAPHGLYSCLQFSRIIIQAGE
jgi:hypothetical protein